jgi:hypothetical protein
MQNHKERLALEKAFDLIHSYSENDGIVCCFHKTKICQLTDCANEANRWIEDKTQPDETFYFCLFHEETEEDPEQFKGKETAVYSCDKDCTNCG